MNDPQLTPEDIENLDEFRVATMWQEFASSALGGVVSASLSDPVSTRAVEDLAKESNVSVDKYMAKVASQAADAMLEEARKRGYAGAESVEPWTEDDELRRAVEE